METNPVFSNNITNMYNENSRGPRTDPCGTPYFTGLHHDVGRSAKHHPNVYAIKEGGAIILAVVLLLPRRVLQTLCFVVKEKLLCLGSKRGQTRNQWLSKIYSTVPEHFNTNIRVCAAQFTQDCPEAGRVAYNASVLKDCFYKAEQFQLCKFLTHSLFKYVSATDDSNVSFEPCRVVLVWRFSNHKCRHGNVYEARCNV